MSDRSGQPISDKYSKGITDEKDASEIKRRMSAGDAARVQLILILAAIAANARAR